MNRTLTKSVMRRVYVLWILKKFVSPTAVKGYILMLLGLQIINSVSIQNILINAPGASDIWKSIVFFGRAFAGTEVFVQALLIGMLVFFTLLTRDILRAKNQMLILR